MKNKFFGVKVSFLLLFVSVSLFSQEIIFSHRQNECYIALTSLHSIKQLNRKNILTIKDKFKDIDLFAHLVCRKRTLETEIERERKKSFNDKFTTAFAAVFMVLMRRNLLGFVAFFVLGDGVRNILQSERVLSLKQLELNTIDVIIRAVLAATDSFSTVLP